MLAEGHLCPPFLGPSPTCPAPLLARSLPTPPWQVDQLRSLLELVVRKEPALLPQFLPEVLELQVGEGGSRDWGGGGGPAGENPAWAGLGLEVQAGRQRSAVQTEMLRLTALDLS